MKVLIFGALEKFEELAIAKYLGEDIFFYKPLKPMYRSNFIKVGEAEFDEDTNIYVEDLGDTLAESKYSAMFEYDADTLRYDESFIALVESSRVLYPNVDVYELEDGEIFRISYDREWITERMERLEKPEWFEVKNGKTEAAF